MGLDYFSSTYLLTYTLRILACTFKRTSMKNKGCVLGIFLGFVISSAGYAQDPTIYVSPHNLDQTLSNIYVSIDRNHHKYLNTVYYEADSAAQGPFVGLVYVVDFMIKGSDQLVACEPTAAMDLPFKILVWSEDSDVYISYISPFIMKRRYFVQGCDSLLDKFNKDMIRIVNDAIRTD